MKTIQVQEEKFILAIREARDSIREARSEFTVSLKETRDEFREALEKITDNIGIRLGGVEDALRYCPNHNTYRGKDA